MRKILIIGLCGLPGSGKSALADKIKETMGGNVVNFADPLYEMLNKLDDGIFQGMAQEAKLKPFAAKPEWTRRYALQYFGTEICRNQINDSIWIDLFNKSVEFHKALGTPLICGDCRFPNEIDAIRKAGGLLVWLTRPGIKPASSHISDNAIGSQDCDVVIANDGTLGQTQAEVFAAYRAIKQ